MPIFTEHTIKLHGAILTVFDSFPLMLKMQESSGSEFLADRFNVDNTPIYDTRKYIKPIQSFTKQYKELSEVFFGQNEYILQEKLKLSLDALVACNPDKILLEVTREGSVFYTIQKGVMKIYFQHFLIDSYDNSDEAVVSVFLNDENIFNYGGNLDDTINRLAEALTPNNIKIFQLV